MFWILNVISFPIILLILNSFFIFLFKKWLGSQGIFYISIVSYFLVIVLSIIEFIYILTYGNYFFIDFGRFFFCLNIIDSHLILCIDELSLILTIMVSFLISFALCFGVEYMYRDAFISRLLYLLNLFATSVIFLFISYDFFLLLIAWELIGLFSFLLVNFYSIRVYTIKAALKTFILSRLSDMFLFIAFILIILIFNTTDLSIIFLEIPFFMFHKIIIMNNVSVHFLTTISLLIVLASIIKAAQFFFHVWLPDAMEAPTPASALIHSSTLVIMGVFLIIRFNLIFEFTVLSNYILMIVGSLTIAFGAITATFQNDIKKLIAYSTISQIGYLVCGCGFGAYDEVLIYLIMHAFNKAFLFILAGFIVHYFSGNTDMRQMGGLFLYVFDIAAYVFVLTFNLAGLPYSAGFYSKEFLIFQIIKDDVIATLVQVSWLLSFVFTPLYMFILVYFVLFDFKKSTHIVYKQSWNITINLIKYYKLFKKSRYQLTALTSKTIIIILFNVFLIFTLLGDYLITLIFNYNLISLNNMNVLFDIRIKQIFNLNYFSIDTLTNVTYLILVSFTVVLFFMGKLTAMQNIQFITKLNNQVILYLFTVLIFIIATMFSSHIIILILTLLTVLNIFNKYKKI